MRIIWKILFVVFLVQSVRTAARGLAEGVANKCSTSCRWDDPTIWIDGIVPASTDTVDIQVRGTYKIQVYGDVTVADFDIGVEYAIADNSGSQTFQVTSGSTFRSTGQYNTFFTVTTIIDSNASLIVSGAGSTQGMFALYGYASFGGSSPSLLIDTANQLPTGIVYGLLHMYNGILVVQSGVSISLTSSLIGSGIINGSVTGNGNIRPGEGDIVGSLIINGDLNLNTATSLYIDIASTTSFDTINVSSTAFLDGQLYLNTLGSYEPLSHTEFVVLNHASSRGGFKTTESSECFVTCINDKWTAVIDQQYTAALYDSASSLIFPFATILLCFLFAV